MRVCVMQHSIIKHIELNTEMCYHADCLVCVCVSVCLCVCVSVCLCVCVFADCMVCVCVLYRVVAATVYLLWEETPPVTLIQEEGGSVVWCGVMWYDMV